LCPVTSQPLFDANYYADIPYVNNGRNEHGVDCWGLVRLFYRKEFSIILPSYTEDYSSPEERIEVSNAIKKHKVDWTEIPQGEEAFGDVIILRLAGYPLHIGVVISTGIMLHTLKKVGTCTEEYTSSKWKNRIFGFVRHKERMNEH
jgi:cell wall-associated NlpC family hydrolase